MVIPNGGARFVLNRYQQADGRPESTYPDRSVEKAGMTKHPIDDGQCHKGIHSMIFKVKLHEEIPFFDSNNDGLASLFMLS